MFLFFIRILYGIILFSLGFNIIKYRRLVVSWTGKFFWAEKYLGNGGTYFVLIIVGILLMFYSVIYPFGGFELLGIKPNNHTQKVRLNN